MNKGSLTEKLRGSHLAKIVILLIATMAIGGLAGCGQASAQLGTSSTSDTPSQQPSQSQSAGATSDIDNASTDQQIAAFLQGFKDAGFPGMQFTSTTVRANWGSANSYHLDFGTDGNNSWTMSTALSGFTAAETIGAVAEKIVPGTDIVVHGQPASVILKIINSIYFKDGVVYEK